MANEATVTCSLSIVADKVRHNKGYSFPADVAEGRGPTPGIVLATTAGIAPSFALLTNPGLCNIQNLSEEFRVVYGMRDTSTGTFLPLGELLPGEGFVLRLARMLGSELTAGAGTGTAGSGGTFWVKGIGGSAYVDIQAFEG